jgi:transposase
MPVSNDTLLRVVCRRTVDQHGDLNVIGIDDFAFRRGQTYGIIVCDLERRRPVTLLPDRALDKSRLWLAKHQSISIVARDRGGGYGEAIAKALPDAEQIADRWHLMENSSRAFLDAVGKSMRQIRQAVGSNVVDPKLLTYAEKLQYEGSAPPGNERGDPRVVEERDLHSTDRASDRSQPEARPGRLAGTASRCVPRTAQLSR